MSKKKLNIPKKNNRFVIQETTHENTMAEEFSYLVRKLMINNIFLSTYDAVAKASNNQISSERLFLLVNGREKATIRDCEIISNVFNISPDFFKEYKLKYCGKINNED